MKIICIGDLHGKNIWKEVDIARYDKVIFMGDYVDSFDHSDEEILQNLDSIIRLKNNNPEKVVLLVGNHDIQYCDPGGGTIPKCSGYRISMRDELWKVFGSFTKGVFQDSYFITDNITQQKYLFSHAGISNKFQKLTKWEIKLDPNSEYNELMFVKYKRFWVGADRGGSDPASGIYWADISETSTDYLKGIHQVVGHSRVKDIVKYGNQDGSITYIDCLDSQTKFLELEI